jgi:1-deoxy-D-xylulose-5-phosphate synthase
VAGLLSKISGPPDVKRLERAKLRALAEEIREHLISSVARTGGHLGPNLGVVELSIALHRVFDSPHDVLLWDTGHQAYVHKMLTGRAADFASLRQADGLSGYPSRNESDHDVIENSHASTALSYADGLAKAFDLTGQRDRAVVAIVGDGALTGGMCWEALNNIAAAPDRPVVIVVNDNGRSYAPTVGGLAQHLNALRLSPSYEQTLELVKTSLSRTPFIGAPIYEALHGMKKGLKDLIQPQAMFEDLGMKYVGPIDGHDIGAVEDALRRARGFGAPVIVHCVTEKGRGYPPAEDDEADCLHGPGAFDPSTGKVHAAGERKWTHVFGDEMLAVGRQRPDVVAVTAAMLEPVGLHPFRCAFPERVFDVGIAEQHAVTSAAGLAIGGLHPVVCLYATFLNRAFDQMLMDVALHRLPVTFVLDRAGVTGDDGPSHNGMWDLSILGLVPGMRVAAPRDATRLRELLREAVDWSTGPTAIRFPKAAVDDSDLAPVDRIGALDLLRRDTDADVLVVAVGAFARQALEVADRVAAQGVGVTVVDPRWVLPVDPGLRALAAAHEVVVTLEDNGIAGGVGDAISRDLRTAGVRTPVRSFGIPQEFLAQGRRAEVLERVGLTAQQIARSIVESTARHEPIDLTARS